MVYRDGVGGPTLMAKVQEYEVPRLAEFLETFSQNYKPKIIYCLVNRNISHRLFVKNGGTELLNPGPGTAVDYGLVENQGDT